MKNALELPLGEEGMLTVYEAVADAMTYEATLALMASVLPVEIDDELKAASSLLDKLTWYIRTSYISGFADGVEIYDAAYSESELYIDSIRAKFETMSSEEYSETVIRVSNFLRIIGELHPVPSIAVEAEEELWSPRRLTSRLNDGTISLRTNERFCLEKLWQYENTGFEPGELLKRSDRPHIDISGAIPDEPLSGKVAEIFLMYQDSIDAAFEAGYAKGKKEERDHS